MKRSIKYFSVGMGIIFVVVLLLVCGASVYMNTDHARNLVLNKINESILGAVTCEKLRLSLIKGELELTDLFLKDPSHEKLAGIDRLLVDISWTPLLKGDVTVQRFIVEAPRVRIQQNRNGEITLMNAFPPSGTVPENGEEKKDRALPVNIVVNSFRLFRGSIEYVKKDGDLKAMVQDLEVSAGGNLSKRSGDLMLRIGKGRLDSPKMQTQIDRFQVDATLRKDRIDPMLVQVGTNSSHVRLSGNVGRLFDNPFLDITVDSSFDLSEIQRALSLQPIFTGEVTAHMTVEGTLDDPLVKCDLAYGGGVIAGLGIDRVDLDLALKDRLLALNTLKAEAASGHLNIKGEIDLNGAFMDGFLTLPGDPEEISYRFFVDQQGMQLGKLFAGTDNLQGIVQSHFSLHGKGVSSQHLAAEMEMDLSVKKLGIGTGASLGDLHLKTAVNLDKGLAGLKYFEVEAGHMKVSVDGIFDSSLNEMKGSIAIETPDLAHTMSTFTTKDIHGQLALKADISGSLKRPAVDCIVQGRDLCFNGMTIGDILLDAGLDESGRVLASLIELDNQGSVMEGKGWIHVIKDPYELDPALPLDVSIFLHDIDPNNFLTEETIQGLIDGKLRLEGSVKALRAALSLHGKNLKTEYAGLGNVHLDLKFSDGLLSLDGLKLDNQGSILHASGSAQVIDPETTDILKDPVIQFSVEGDTIRLEDFADGLKGRFSLTALCRGRLSNPVGTLNLLGRDIDLGVQKLKEIRVVSEFDKEKIRITHIALTVVPGEVIEASGWFSLEKAFHLELRSEGFSLHHIEKVKEKDIGKGKMALRISGKGTLDDPQIQGEINLRDVSFKGKAVDDFTIHLDVRDQLARMQGKLNFDIHGSYHLQNKEFEVSAAFNETDLHPYFKMANLPDFTGTVSGTVEAMGNMSNIDTLALAADLSKMDLFFKGAEIMRTEEFDVSFREGEIRVPALHMILLNRGWIHMEGQGTLDGPLALKVNGRIPLQGIRPFVEDLPDIQGDLLLSADIGGTRADPDIQAEVEMKNAALTVPGLSQKLHDLNGSVLVSPQTITIDNIIGKLDAGRFALDGSIRMEKLRPVAILVNVDANALPLEIPEMLDLLLNAKLKIHGSKEKSLIEGETVILEGVYFKDVNLSLISLVRQRKREEEPLPTEIRVPFLKNMGLNISLKRHNPLVVDNNLANLEVTPDLHVSGRLDSPVIKGRAGIDNGTINYQKKTFVVKKGVIDFVNPYKTEPVIDIKSEVQIRSWKIFLEISGTLDELVFKLASDPPEADEDILSLLVLGKTTSELIEGEGGTSQTTAQMLTELIASTFGEDIKKATGLDILEVETQGEEGEEASDRIKVTIGKKLSRRMVVKYATETKDGEISQRAIAEYNLLENILLSSFQDSRGMFGGEVRFRLEFR